MEYSERPWTDGPGSGRRPEEGESEEDFPQRYGDTLFEETEREFGDEYGVFERTSEIRDDEDPVLAKIWEALSTLGVTRAFPHLDRIPHLKFRNPRYLALALRIWSSKPEKLFGLKDFRQFNPTDKLNVARYLNLVITYYDVSQSA